MTGTRPTRGTVAALHRSSGHRLPMEVLWEAVFVADRGIAGDQHARPGSRWQVLLIDEETLDRFGLVPGEVRENVTTRGLDLGRLRPSQTLRLGDQVLLEVTGLCEPCERMDELQPGLMAALEGQRGILARTLSGGRVRPGDPIVVEAHASAGHEKGVNAWRGC